MDAKIPTIVISTGVWPFSSFHEVKGNDFDMSNRQVD